MTYTVKLKTGGRFTELTPDYKIEQDGIETFRNRNDKLVQIPLDNISYIVEE